MRRSNVVALTLAVLLIVPLLPINVRVGTADDGGSCDKLSGLCPTHVSGTREGCGSPDGCIWKECYTHCCGMGDCPPCNGDPKDYVDSCDGMVDCQYCID